MDPEGHITDPAYLRIKERFETLLAELDAAVGELLRTVNEETTVMVVSDHGLALRTRPSMSIDGCTSTVSSS